MIAQQIRTSTDTPEWVHRADWSSKDALLAFWSAHPPALRNAFLKARAAGAVTHFREQICALRHKQHELWLNREQLIDDAAARIAELPDSDSDVGRRKRKDIQEDAKEHLGALRTEMRVLRADVRRCIKYLRAIEPKKERINE